MKYFNNISAICTAFLMALFVAASPALSQVQEQEQEQQQSFNTWDEDGDGYLSESEFETVLDDIAYLHSWDSDNDMVLSDVEWGRAIERHLQDRYTVDDYGQYGEWDLNADSNIDEEEFRTGLLRMIDENGDRMISEEEFSTWYRPDE